MFHDNGVPMAENWKLPRGQVFSISDPAIHPWAPVIMAHPSTMMEILNGGTTPLWTRHMLGVKEAERDRRRPHR